MDYGVCGFRLGFLRGIASRWIGYPPLGDFAYGVCSMDYGVCGFRLGFGKRNRFAMICFPPLGDGRTPH